MKKILFVVEAFGGGVFMHLANLSNQLCQYFDVYIAYGIRPQTHKNLHDYFDGKVHLVQVRNFTASIDPLKDLKAVFELQRICKEIAPDIIHLHSSKAGAIGRIALSGQNRPLFYTPHGWAFLKLDDSAFKRFAYRNIEKICAWRKSSILATSQGEYDEAVKISRHSLLINNGIDMKSLCAYKNEKVTPSNTPVVYTLGRICYQKNPIMFNDVAKEMPDIRFLWIGDGEMRDVLTSPNIEVTGWGPRNEALALIGHASVFFLPSLWEGLPLSLLEAMFLRKVCVVSNVIGNRDVIHSNINGLIAHDKDEYVKSIRSILYSSVNREKMLDQASLDIEKEYNTIVMANKYKEVYLKSLS